MIEEYVPMDKRQIDFYAQLMEQRVQKLNNRSMEDSLSSIYVLLHLQRYESATLGVIQ